MGANDKPSKQAVRKWLLWRQASRLPLPEPELMLLQLQTWSMPVLDDSRVDQAGVNAEAPPSA